MYPFLGKLFKILIVQCLKKTILVKGLRWLAVTLLSDELSDHALSSEQHYVHGFHRFRRENLLNNHSILVSFLKGRRIYSVAVKRVASLRDNHNLQHKVFLMQIRLLKRERPVGGF